MKGITFLIAAVCILFSSNANAASVCFNKSCVNVDVMRTAEDQRRGLQGREKLDADQGMLFVFDQDDRYRFWMKDMKIPIDMLWLDQNGVIVTVLTNVQPCLQEDKCPTYLPLRPARYVLEVQAGYATRHHLKVAQRVVFKDI